MVIGGNKMQKNKELYGIVFIYIVVGLFFQQSFSLSKDAALFPRFLSILIFIMNTLYLFNLLKEKDIKITKKDFVTKKFLTILFLSVIYVFLLSILGFVIATFLFLIISMKLLKAGSNKVIFIISFLTVLIIYVSFSMLLNVPIPVGVFEVI